MEEIAQTAGCSVGNIYHYFKSKDELAGRAGQAMWTIRPQRAGGGISPAGHRQPAGKKLLDFVGRSLEISVSDPVLYKAFIELR